MDLVIGGFEGAMSRESCSVKLPWPVPASRIWREGWLRLCGLGGSISGEKGSAWISRSETIVEAYVA